MGLEPYALTSVQKIRRIPALKRLGSDSETTDWIEETINGYSLALKHWTGREFMPKTPGDGPPETTLEREFSYDGQGALSLEPYEAREITAVKLYVGTLAPQTIAAADWYAGAGELRGKSEEGTYLWVRPRRITDLSLTLTHETAWSERWRIGIVGRWGAGVVPAAIELACRIAVANHLLSPEGFARRRLGELELDEAAETTDDWLQALPRASRNLARPYQRQKARKRHRVQVTA